MDSDGPTADALKNDLLRLPIEEITRIFAGRLRAAYTFVTDHIVGVLKSTIDKSDYEKALMATYGRIYLWVEAIVALKESRHFQVVHAGGRSIFELLLDLKLLSLDPSSAEKFHAFTKFEFCRYFDFPTRLARGCMKSTGFGFALALQGRNVSASQAEYPGNLVKDVFCTTAFRSGLAEIVLPAQAP